MKTCRLILTAAGALVLLLLTPACDMQSAATTVPGYQARESQKARTADQPEPANPEPPKYFGN
jgi:hypothetical protein